MDASSHIQARNTRTAATTWSGCVWWAAWRAPSMTTTRPSVRRASRATVASRKTGRPRPRSCRTGWRTAANRSSEAAGSASASSSRRIVPAAAARTGQIDRPIGREVWCADADDLGQERGERTVAIAGRQLIPETLLDAGGVVARPRWRRRSLIRDHPPDRIGLAVRPRERTALHTSARTRRPISPDAAASVSATVATSSNSRSIEYGPTASPDAPRPRRSIAWTVNEPASIGPTTRNAVWSAVAPWTSTNPGPSPLEKTAIGVSSRDPTTIDGAVCITDRAATHSGCRAGPRNCWTRRRCRR